MFFFLLLLFFIYWLLYIQTIVVCKSPEELFFLFFCIPKFFYFSHRNINDYCCSGIKNKHLFTCGESKSLEEEQKRQQSPTCMYCMYSKRLKTFFFFSEENRNLNLTATGHKLLMAESYSHCVFGKVWFGTQILMMCFGAASIVRRMDNTSNWRFIHNSDCSEQH